MKRARRAEGREVTERNLGFSLFVEENVLKNRKRLAPLSVFKDPHLCRQVLTLEPRFKMVAFRAL
jgi:hypothetical protein